MLALVIGAGLASGIGSASEHVQASRPPPTATAPGGQKSGLQVDPKAVEALREMGKELRKLEAFQVKATTSTDFVLESGLVDTVSGTMNLVVRKPDRLLATVRQDGLQRDYFYDGKTMTLHAPEDGYYASKRVHGTIRELVVSMERENGLELPLADLFRWGGDEDPAAGLSAAVDLGPSEVGGVSCQHFAFRQEGLDWQVWIQRGEFPLPRKMVLTTLTDPARPQYEVEMDWNLAPAFNEAAFRFEPPAGSQRVVLVRPGPSELGFGGSGEAGQERSGPARPKSGTKDGQSGKDAAKEGSP